MIPVEPMLLHHAEQDFVLDDKWVLELKYDGVRAIVDTRNNPLVVYTRKGVDITFQFPEVQPPAGHIFDGEIVGFNDKGFHKLNYVQRRMGVSTRSKVLERMRIYPIKFVAFDILDDLSLDYETRIQPLIQMMANDPSTSLWDISPTWDASKIDKLWNIVEKNNFEGLVAKRLDSTYVPGIRTYNWRKIKHNKPDYRE